MGSNYFSLKLGRVRRAFRTEFDLRAAPLGVTTPQYLVLSRLWRSDGVSTSTLAKDINAAGSTTTGVLDRLEQKGLIRRDSCPSDRRTVRIRLTESGRAMQQPLMEIVSEINQKALEGFSSEQKEEFLNALDKVSDNLERRARC